MQEKWINEENEFYMDSMSEDNAIQKTNIENLNNDSSNNIIDSEEVIIKN